MQFLQQKHLTKNSKMLFISIPTPCNENWNEMTPNEQGAFCKVCSKTVVDFTHMNDDEVKNYFLKNATTKTCGHFKNSQLEEPVQLQLINNLIINKTPYWQKFLAIAIISFSSLLTTSCNNSISDRTIGEIPISISHQQNSSTPSETAIGIPFTKDTTNTSTKQIRKKNCKPTINTHTEPTVDGQVIMGKIAFIDSSTTPNQIFPTLPSDTLKNLPKD
jgi:hypothetical protein